MQPLISDEHDAAGVTRDATEADRVVILARGLGTRMRKEDASAGLDETQATAANSGVKGMIPIGRPFLDFVLTAIADAGFKHVCIVIGPEHEAISDYYSLRAPPSRVSVTFAVQEKPLGTADAVLAAEEFARGYPFVVINSDNYYPVEALAKLRETPAPALVGFARSTLVESGNVAADRVERFGALEIDEKGILESITPRKHAAGPPSGEVYASMNCWLFDSRIFDVCRTVPMSQRGELELTRAVQMAVDSLGMQFTVVPMNAAVLDLSTRADIASVKERLSASAVSY